MVAQDDCSRNQEPRTVVSRRGVGRRNRGACVCGGSSMCIRTLNVSMSGRGSITVICEEGNRENVEEDGIAWTESEDL